MATRCDGARSVATCRVKTRSNLWRNLLVGTMIRGRVSEGRHELANELPAFCSRELSVTTCAAHRP